MKIETEEEFTKAQEELIEAFKAKMKVACEDVLGRVYTDVTPHAVTDAHINFRNALRDELTEEFKKDILDPTYGHYSWASSIRMALLKNHSDEIRNALISDLQGKIETLEDRCRQLQERRW